MASARARDTCVVDTGPLRDILQDFVAEWSRSRRADGARFTEARGASAAAARWHGEQTPSSREVTQLRPFEYLAAESGVPEWRIRKIAQARRPTTELRDADALVAAIGCPQVFCDGTLEIRPNPRAAKSARDKVCRSSLTGTA